MTLRGGDKPRKVFFKMKNIWLSEKSASISHRVYGCGTEVITLPQAFPVDRVLVGDSGQVCVESLVGSKSKSFLLWLSEDLLLLDGKAYRRASGFHSVRRRRRGVFFDLVAY